ncbi:MAG: S9 family peptidase, partial [Simkania negevensis]|nr:S9 family peptidase [Simkania negevensis]
KLGPSYSVLSQTLLGDLWVLVTDLPDRGKEFWLYNRPRQELSLLYASLEPHEFSKMYPLSLKARDGRELISYLTLPKEFDLDGDVAFPLPLVVFPHGGPFKVRDRYIFHPFHQWLASRGYAVLSVNFRLSSGFGKEFVSAGNGEWGGKAHLDVIDAVEECIKRGITEKGKLAVVGGSYGGYEALAGLTFTPDFYTCIVALCAPSNLKTVLQGVPSYWELLATPFSERTLFFTKKAFIISMGGDPEKPQEAPYLEKCSPLNYVDNIQKPLLLIHGANDHIVQEKESQQIYEGMKKSQKPVTYLSFPDEGHGIEKFANKMHFLALIEKFLAKHLGGREEPLQEEIQRASSANVQD